MNGIQTIGFAGLDPGLPRGDVHPAGMTREQMASMAEQLRQAIKADGRSLAAIAKAADVPYSALHGFMNEGRDVRISTAEALAKAVGIARLKVNQD